LCIRVCCSDQLAHDLKTFRRLEIDRQGALVAIARKKGCGHAVASESGAPHKIAGRRLHLDHLGALVGEHHRGDRAGHHRGQIENSYTF
jgi:hypothetical protein